MIVVLNIGTIVLVLELPIPFNKYSWKSIDKLYSESGFIKSALHRYPTLGPSG
jgi:hypothetical protein